MYTRGMSKNEYTGHDLRCTCLGCSVTTSTGFRVGDAVIVSATHGVACVRTEYIGTVTAVSPDGRKIDFSGESRQGIAYNFKKVPVKRVSHA